MPDDVVQTVKLRQGAQLKKSPDIRFKKTRTRAGKFTHFPGQSLPSQTVKMKAFFKTYHYLISRFDKQRCTTASFIESAYLISKFAKCYALSSWQKCIQRTPTIVE